MRKPQLVDYLLLTLLSLIWASAFFNIKIATYSCAHLDTQSDVFGLKDHATELLEVLQELRPGRFTSTGRVEDIESALDAFLADILAC